MKTYSLVINIADLFIHFTSSSESDISLLGEKYIAYKGGAIKQRGYQAEVIIVKDHKKNITMKDKVFHLSLPSLVDNFEDFNIFLRRIIFYIINRNDGFILHASSLINYNAGFVFTGPAGSGKSTIRKLYPELVSLGDDSAVVRRIGEKYYLFGSPFYQRTKIAYPNMKVCIKSVVKINKSSKNRLIAMSFSDSIKTIIGNTFISFIGNIEDEKVSLMRTVFHFCQQNKIYKLSFQKDRSLLTLIENTAE